VYSSGLKSTGMRSPVTVLVIVAFSSAIAHTRPSRSRCTTMRRSMAAMT
jgi:hypothetical protein